MIAKVDSSIFYSKLNKKFIHCLKEFHANKNLYMM